MHRPKEGGGCSEVFQGVRWNVYTNCICRIFFNLMVRWVSWSLHIKCRTKNIMHRTSHITQKRCFDIFNVSLILSKSISLTVLRIFFNNKAIFGSKCWLLKVTRTENLTLNIMIFKVWVLPEVSKECIMYTHRLAIFVNASYWPTPGHMFSSQAFEVH